MKIQEFTRKNMPEYYESKDVARLSELEKFLSGDMVIKEIEVSGLKEKPTWVLFQEYRKLQEKLFHEAYKNFEAKNKIPA